MPRTKGSKNKPKTATADFTSQIAEKQSAREALSAEITSITTNMESLNPSFKCDHQYPHQTTTHPEERIWAEQTPPAAAPGPGRSEDQARQGETILHD